MRSKFLTRPKNLLILSFFALLLFMGHRTGFITVLALFCLLISVIVPFRRYTDSLSGLLIVFTICFTFIGMLNGCIDSVSTAIAYFIPSVFFYCFGRYIVDELDYKSQIFPVLIFVITLYSFELYTSTINAIFSTGSLVNTSRLFYFAGDEGRQLTATLVGLGASLGFIGLPMSILYKEKTLVRCLFLILFILSIIVTIHLVNRTGLVICVLVLLVTLFYYYKANISQLLLALIISIILYFILLKIGVFSKEVFDAYASRNEVDLATGGGRTERWEYALQQLFLSPMGWAENSGKTDFFVHNMWLDIAKITGVIPFVLLISCTISSVKVLLKLLHIKRDLVVAVLLALNVCFFCSCFVEPVYGGLHFFLYVMLWGMQKQCLVRFYKS